MQYEINDLRIRPSIPNDIASLDQIRTSVKYIAKWMSKKANELDYSFEEGFSAGWDLPPEIPNESYQVLSIENKSGIIGYIALTKSYPQDDSVWISILAIDPAYHRLGLGKQVVRGLIKQIQTATSFNKVSLAVDLKNWIALRFWINLGFRNITKVTGDHSFSINNYAKIQLELNLD